MTRVLHLFKGLGRGGAEQLLLYAAPYLDRSRFEHQAAYLLPWKDALVEPLRAQGIPAHCLDGAKGFGWIPRLRSLVRHLGIQIVHAHSPMPAAIGRMVIPRSVEQVYTEHGVWEHHHRATRLLNALTYWRNDHVFAVSKQVFDSIRYPRPLGMLPKPRTETLHHGIDLDAIAQVQGPDGMRAEFGIESHVPIVGTVGNFRRLKGHTYLLSAATRVRETFPDVRFVLVGTGPLEDQVRLEARRLGLDGSVVFTGSRSDATRLMSSFDVFVLSSLYEGLSIAMLEAMALGKPVVATSVGGLPEVVEHGTEGYLVPPGDPPALATAIELLLADGNLRGQMGRAARKRALGFDIRHAVDRIESVYEELL